MDSAAAHDPKAGEKTYYARLGEDGRRHAKAKPFSDADCGKYLCNMGALREKRNQVIGLPVKIPDSDGAPARVIAIEEEA